MDLTQLHEMFRASQFLHALTVFVQKHLLHVDVLSSLHDKYHTFKQIKIKVPSNKFTRSSINFDRICASPAITKPNPRHPLQCACFDAALIIEDPILFEKNGHSGVIGKCSIWSVVSVSFINPLGRASCCLRLYDI